MGVKVILTLSELFMLRTITAASPRRIAPSMVALAVCMGALSTPALADEKSDLIQLRATTLSLIQALVDGGLLSKDKADEIMNKARMAGEVAAHAAPAAAAASPGATEATTPPVIHVPYLSETTKAALREEIKQEVLAQAHDERWGEPGALPDWISQIKVDGEVTARWERYFFDKNNLAPDASNGYATQTLTNSDKIAWSPDLDNTQHDLSHERIKARLGFTSTMSEDVTTGIALATSGFPGQVSTSQTLGTDFNKYPIYLDKAYISLKALGKQVDINAGRFADPFIRTDLSWPDDLNFDGAAASYHPTILPQSNTVFYATAGAFPLLGFGNSSNSSLSTYLNGTYDKWLYGMQLGISGDISAKTQFKAAISYYDFDGIEGVPNTSTVTPTGASAYAQPFLPSEYPASVRQKGNTLFLLNQGQVAAAASAGTSVNNVWGLASQFRPLDVMTEFAFKQYSPYDVYLSFDYINNLGFSLSEIRDRTKLGSALQLAQQTAAYQIKLKVGAEQIVQPGQWQATLAFRRLERDAWVDAFTDSTWNIGGTNYQGWSLGGRYGVARNTSVGMRWISTRSLPDNTQYLDANGNSSVGLSGVPFKVDILQFDLNSRF